MKETNLLHPQPQPCLPRPPQPGAKFRNSCGAQWHLFLLTTSQACLETSTDWPAPNSVRSTSTRSQSIRTLPTPHPLPPRAPLLPPRAHSSCTAQDYQVTPVQTDLPSLSSDSAEPQQDSSALPTSPQSPVLGWPQVRHRAHSIETWAAPVLMLCLLLAPFSKRKTLESFPWASAH